MDILQALPNELHICWDNQTRRIWLDGKLLTPVFSLAIRNHSPDGFNVGYGGSGPAQLALAILLKFIPKDLALEYYVDFKWSVVAKWPRETFAVNLDLRAAIMDVIKQRTQEKIK